MCDYHFPLNYIEDLWQEWNSQKFIMALFGGFHVVVKIISTLIVVALSVSKGKLWYVLIICTFYVSLQNTFQYQLSKTLIQKSFLNSENKHF